jgi:hypothetical protein
VLPELIKRLVETGYEKITEGPENVRQFVSELKLPKDVANLLLAQLEETKGGLYKVVTKELREFLTHTSLSDELVKVLTRLSLEVKTEIRFVPSDDARGMPRPDVSARVKVRDEERPERPGQASSPPPEPTAPEADPHTPESST